VVSLLAVFGKIREKGTGERGSRAMSEMQLAEMGTFCMNEACEDYQKIKPDNLIKYGQTEKGVQRYRCKTCKKTFTATKGTMFYRLRHSEEEVVECLEMVGDRNSLAAIHRIKGIKEETVCSWMEKAEEQVKQVEDHVVIPYKLRSVQIDALWTFVGHKGEKGGS
jgi:transposase-like protein